MKHLRNFITARRKASGLSATELALLMGLARSAYSQLELGQRRPRFETVLALEILFGESLSALFPESYELREERIMAAASRLEERLRQRTDDRSRAKLQFFNDIAKRARDRSGL